MTPGTAPAPGSPLTASPPRTCATTTTSPTLACSKTASSPHARSPGGSACPPAPSTTGSTPDPSPPGPGPACLDRPGGSAHQHRDTDPAPQAGCELSITQVASRLGVKPDVIYAWAEWGHIPP